MVACGYMSDVKQATEVPFTDGSGVAKERDKVKELYEIRAFADLFLALFGAGFSVS